MGLHRQLHSSMVGPTKRHHLGTDSQELTTVLLGYTKFCARRLGCKLRGAKSGPRTATVHCPDLTSSAPGHSGGQERPNARCTRAAVREWTLETLETLRPAIYDYTVYQYVLNP